MDKLLIVEDNSLFRKTLIRLLSERFSRMQIEGAADGKGAMEKVAAFCPHIILMDVQLPDQNGFELTRKIRMSDREVTIVILTNHDEPEYRQAANQYGADYFISKTDISSDEMFHLLDSIVLRPVK